MTHSNQDVIKAFQETAEKNNKLILELKKERDFQLAEYFCVLKVGENEDVPKFEIQENIITQSSSEHLQKKFFPKPEIKTLPVDVFNLKTDFSVTTFVDIVRLNEAQKEEVARYGLFGESSYSRPALQILLENNLILNKLLEETIAAMLDPKNNMQEAQQTLSTISNAFGNLKKLNVQFFLPDGLAKKQAVILAKKQVEQGILFLFARLLAFYFFIFYL
jgi:hypothetical protein